MTPNSNLARKPHAPTLCTAQNATAWHVQTLQQQQVHALLVTTTLPRSHSSPVLDGAAWLHDFQLCCHLGNSPLCDTVQKHHGGVACMKATAACQRTRRARSSCCPAALTGYAPISWVTLAAMLSVGASVAAALVLPFLAIAD